VKIPALKGEACGEKAGQKGIRAVIVKFATVPLKEWGGLFGQNHAKASIFCRGPVARRGNGEQALIACS